MNRKALDPNLASILDSIRATVSADEPPVRLVHPEPDDQPAAEPTAAAPDATLADTDAQPAARKARAARKAGPVPQAEGRSVEEFLAELIRPQVKDWLDAHLPELIQKMAADEIARLIGTK